MSEWKTENGYLVKTYRKGNATITICRPILSDADRKRRYDEIRRVIATLPHAVVNDPERDAV